MVFFLKFSAFSPSHKNPPFLIYFLIIMNHFDNTIFSKYGNNTYWFMRKTGMLSLQSAQSKRKAAKKDDYNYMDEDYIDTAVAMMNLARENFLVLLDSKDYQKGDGRYIICWHAIYPFRFCIRISNALSSPAKSSSRVNDLSPETSYKRCI